MGRKKTETKEKGAGVRKVRAALVGGAPANKRFPVVCVGASAGGLEAFTQLLRALPSDTNMAFVLVQHLDPKHESMLSTLLAKATDMPIQQVEDGMVVRPHEV